MTSYLTRIVSVINYKLLFVGETQCLSYKRGKLYVHSNIMDTPVYFGKLPLTAKHAILSMFRLTERLFRLEPRIAVEICEGKILLSFCGAAYCVDTHKGTIQREVQYRQGMNNPLNFCKIDGIAGFDNCIAFGEYWGNTDREPVSIYIRKEANWILAYTFPKGTVQHIHGLVADKFRNCVLILTGDKDNESGIWVAKNNFSVVEPILYGSQRYRSCVLFPLPEGVLYATDTPLEKNQLIFINMRHADWSEHIIYDMPGPCIYGTFVEGQYVFATSVEPDSRITGIKYLLSDQLGPGVNDRNSHIVIGNLCEGFSKAVAFEKDFLPMGLFQFGNVQFPNGVMRTSGFVMYPVSVRKYDGRTLVLQFESKSVANN